MLAISIRGGLVAEVGDGRCQPAAREWPAMCGAGPSASGERRPDRSLSGRVLICQANAARCKPSGPATHSRLCPCCPSDTRGWRCWMTEAIPSRVTGLRKPDGPEAGMRCSPSFIGSHCSVYGSCQSQHEGRRSAGLSDKRRQLKLRHVDGSGIGRSCGLLWAVDFDVVPSQLLELSRAVFPHAMHSSCPTVRAPT
jgi:hypothetical protein